MTLMIFLSALCIAIPLLVAWWKITLWDAEARRDADRS